MQLRNLFKEDDAVSPVIGVILMVAITVILAAVIGAFVLDIGGSQEAAPQAQWDWSQNVESDSGTNVGVISLSHGGGSSISDSTQLTLQQGSSSSTIPEESYSAGDLVGVALNDTQSTYTGMSNTEYAASDIVIADISDSGTVELVWASSDGSSSQVLTDNSYSFPN